MGPDSIRPAAVAGSWYPGTAGALARDLDGYLADVDVPALPAGRVDAVIAPHAGLMFSGPVGAYAYKAAAAGAPYDAAILVGPSHFLGFDGVAAYPSGAFATPLGAAPIDRALAAELIDASPVVHARPDAHRREHSLEMQLPFMRRLLPDVPIVPLLMGYQTVDTIRALARTLATVGAGRRVLLVASTDLSHYFDAATAERLDARVRDAVAAFDAEALLAVFEQVPEGERGRCVACGGGPMIAVMMAAHGRGARHGRVLRYMHSGQISGDNSGVVGYLAAALGTFAPRQAHRDQARERRAPAKREETDRAGEREGRRPSDMFTDAQKQALVNIAREAVRAAVGAASGLIDVSGAFPDASGAFVTLKRHGRLRGCIGTLRCQRPLPEEVRRVAVSAAREDPRFQPLTASELVGLEVEVSVLGPLESIDPSEPSAFEIGRHGLVVEQGYRRGLLLPQVAIEWGWDREVFLAQTCGKAGLPPEAWRHGARIYRFAAEVFGDTNPADD